MTGRRRFAVFSLLLVALLVSAGLLLPHLLGSESLKDFAFAGLERTLGRRIEATSVRLEIFPIIRLELTGLTLRDASSTRVFLRAKRFDLVLRLFPLLRGEVRGKRLIVEEPEVTLRRDARGHWNLGAAGSEPTGPSEEIASPLAPLMAIREVSVANGQVTVLDDSRGEQRSLGLKAVDAVLTVAPGGLRADVRASATIPGDHGVSALTINGAIEATEPAPAVGVEPRAAHASAFRFEGTVVAGNLSIRQMLAFFGPGPVPEQAPGAASLQALVKFGPGVVGYDVLLSDTRVTLEGVAIGGQASVSGLLTTQQTFSVTFATSPFPVQTIVDHVPAQWLDPRVRAFMIEHEVEGMVEVVTASLTGAATPALHVSLTGELRVRDGRGRLAGDREVEGLSALVSVHPDRIKVAEVVGWYGRMRITGGLATVTFREGGAWLDLEVPGRMAAADVVGWMGTSLAPGAQSRILQGLREVKGEMGLKFKLAGALGSEDGVQFQAGEFEGQDLQFISDLLPEPVAGLGGRVVVRPGRVELQPVAGRLGRAPFELRGAIATGAEPSFEGFEASMRMDETLAARLLPTGLLPPKTLAGTLGLTVRFGARLTAPTIKARLDLKDARLEGGEVLQKPAGSPAWIDLEGSLVPDRRLRVERLELALEPLRLTAKGTVTLGRKVAVVATIVSGPIDLAEVRKHLQVGPVERGTLEVSLDVNGRGKDWRAWRYTGWVALTGGELAVKGLDTTVKDVFVRLQLVRNGAELKRLAFKVLDSDVQASGRIRDWAKLPAVSLKVTSSQLDLDLLIPKGGRSPLRDALEELAGKSRTSAGVTIEHGVYKGLTFTGLSGRVTIGNGRLVVDRIEGTADGGRVAGRLRVALPKLQPAEAEVSVQLAQVPFEKMLLAAGDDSRLVFGELTGDGLLRGSGRDPRGVLHSLKGSIEVQLRNGHIQRGTILPKILAILNLPMLLQGKVDLKRDGLPFEKVTGTYTFQNGLVTSENIVLDGPVIKMSAAGSYDMVSDRLDAVVAVSPLGAYSKFIKGIPLFGKLFIGERKGIDTAMFEVRGPLRDPVVHYMPLKSLTTGLTGLAQLAFDVLKNTVLLPKNLLGTDEEEPAAEKPQKLEPAPSLPAAPAP